MRTKLYLQIYASILRKNIVKKSMHVGILIGALWASIYIIILYNFMPDDPSIYIWALSGVVFAGSLEILLRLAVIIFIKAEKRKLLRDDGP